MAIEFNKNTGSINIKLSGRMDTLGSVEADKVIAENLFKLRIEDFSGQKLVFDLEDVDFVSSAFMRICLKYAKSVDQGNFGIINTNLNIKKTFKIAGLDKVINIS